MQATNLIEDTTECIAGGVASLTLVIAHKLSVRQKTGVYILAAWPIAAAGIRVVEVTMATVAVYLAFRMMMARR